jgi:flagellar biosynthesis/type III secretory pathway M-ring protein FliF/YscJ
MALIFLIMPVYFVSALGTKVDEFYTESRKSQRIILGVIIMMFVGTLYALMDLN